MNMCEMGIGGRVCVTWQQALVSKVAMWVVHKSVRDKPFPKGEDKVMPVVVLGTPPSFSCNCLPQHNQVFLILVMWKCDGF